jgi:hypothetical protein
MCFLASPETMFCSRSYLSLEVRFLSASLNIAFLQAILPEFVISVGVHWVAVLSEQAETALPFYPSFSWFSKKDNTSRPVEFCVNVILMVTCLSQRLLSYLSNIFSFIFTHRLLNFASFRSISCSFSSCISLFISA